MENGFKIQKILSEKGICSRRQAEKFILENNISINGKPVVLGQRILGTEKILLKGVSYNLAKIQPKFEIIAFHKPLGVECTWRKMKEGKTLANYDFGQKLFCVGRLDKNSSGLLLLTNHGELNNRLMHPSFGHSKIYSVELKDPMKNSFLKQFSNGTLQLDGLFVQKCVVQKINPLCFQVTLKEGKKRQIRRMVELLGNTVNVLQRIQIENIILGNLKASERRFLTFSEKKELFLRVDLPFHENIL